MDIVEKLRTPWIKPEATPIEFAEAADEIERLRQCLKWQQDREATIGTHGPKCFMWGHRHYECALQEIESLRKELSDLRQEMQDMMTAAGIKKLYWDGTKYVEAQ